MKFLQIISLFVTMVILIEAGAIPSTRIQNFKRVYSGRSDGRVSHTSHSIGSSSWENSDNYNVRYDAVHEKHSQDTEPQTRSAKDEGWFGTQPQTHNNDDFSNWYNYFENILPKEDKFADMKAQKNNHDKKISKRSTRLRVRSRNNINDFYQSWYNFFEHTFPRTGR